jgi:hypothetical protein
MHVKVFNGAHVEAAALKAATRVGVRSSYFRSADVTFGDQLCGQSGTVFREDPRRSSTRLLLDPAAIGCRTGA